ncbi:DUF742 domain-containing protein [Actinophytocola xinjiangensis]|uniref:DUF742 domain-containing protein n=1 Tax=Actinophytocola xinjiangensis TaxID=485602 RepID=UPI000A8E543F|nr:DUF742 domain-containing protein [Actinophytocola xinjiangensis]
MSYDEFDNGTFADLVNGLTFAGRGRKRGKGATMSTSDTRVENGSGQEIMKRIDWRPAPVSDHEFDADAAIVRPYAWTRGRTKSTVDLRIEVMVSTSELGEDIDALPQIEHRSVAELCAEPRSVAEVATMLAVPLGVAKVLLGDMAGLGLVIVHKTATGGANKAHLRLMERVLSGLRRL